MSSDAQQGPASTRSETGSDLRSELSYESASARLEEIVRLLDSGEPGLRDTLELCREGRELIAFCASELDAVGQGLSELRLDELVARLEAGPTGPPAPEAKEDPS